MLKKITALVLGIFFLPMPCYALGTSAEGCVVINAATRQVLYKDNENKRLGMASTTKIMTAIVALENKSTQDIIKVSANAQNQEGSSIYLRTGDEMKLEDLLYGLMLNSGNDAAVAIAEGVGGTVEDFVSMMNKKAGEIGCCNTHFINPNGLSDPMHYSTAYDMALIMAYAMENEEFLKIASTKEYQIVREDSVTYLRNHNKLLWQYKNCIGGKTGYTKSTGRCLVSCAEKDGIRLIAVTLNDRDDWKDHKDLFEYTFEDIENVEVIQRYEILSTKKIRGKKVNLLAAESFELPLKDGRKNGLVCKIHMNEAVNSTILPGMKIGYADIYFKNYKTGSIDIISGQEVKENAVDLFCSSINHTLKHVLLKK